MSNICLKVTIEKKWPNQNFDFKILKSLSPVQKVSSCNLKIRCLEAKMYLYFERNYDVLKSKSPCFLLNKNIKFNKNETESDIEKPTHSASIRLAN